MNDFGCGNILCSNNSAVVAMGKRATTSTKGGKFMNPTDQARKEARRRELKKNKKQRQLVRTAVLKGKNPRDIIFELEKVDDMEFNIVSPSPLNQKVRRGQTLDAVHIINVSKDKAFLYFLQYSWQTVF